MEIGQLVLEKKIIEGFLSYMDMTVILVMRPASGHSIFDFLVPNSLHTKRVQNCPRVFKKMQFYFSDVNDLGPRLSDDFDLQYSHNFIYSICGLHLPTLRSQAATVSEKSIVFTFPIEKPVLPNLTLP